MKKLQTVPSRASVSVPSRASGTENAVVEVLTVVEVLETTAATLKE